MVKVLFVCLGNICRSPTAHGVFVHQVLEAGLSDWIEVDSAGTSGWHEGAKPDKRSMKEAARQGYDLSFIRSRQVRDSDFDEFDYVLAMDESNLSDLLAICPQDHAHKVQLFLSFGESLEHEVPDPYYGGEQGFTHVLSLVEQGGQSLLQHIQNHAQSDSR
ncbi:low molecular weight protein-tyrosine-phosphatase [Endozoicomonas arenosclerae]|uniref:low molecular weight protein-tyrosine-phosphatase n=1 Tax=Endozoicomonas arenosclerae TaxID=1633495 RepID=UPI000785825A|nr:low molecular weight protein-tyrosine-phosphatase [Endozoicomonas arenosclerae]